jgi:uncharacterized RDD family membrane protein YckC
VLAGRGTRLGAILLDGVIGVALAIPLVIGMVMDPDAEGTAFMIGGVVASLLTLGLFIYQLMLLNENGWTLGKKILGIRIVRTDGSDCGLGRIFGLRMVLNGLIGAIPVIGLVYSLLDPLFIFGGNQRCIHDYIADTIVVQA